MNHRRTWRRGLAVAIAAVMAWTAVPALATESTDDAVSASAELVAPAQARSADAAAAQATAAAAAPVATTDAGWDFLRVVNTSRVNKGAAPLTVRGSLNGIAQPWANQQRGTYAPQTNPNLENQLPSGWTTGVQVIYAYSATSASEAVNRMASELANGDWDDPALVDLGIAVSEAPYVGNLKTYTFYAFAINLPHSKAAANELTLYRFYRPNTGTHFYSTSAAERNNVAKNPGYRYEGQVAYVLQPSVKTSGTSALNRFYTPSTGTHFYTSSPTEYQRVLTFPQYSLDGVAAKVYTGKASGVVPMYRFFKPGSGTHFYSANAAEVASVKQMPGYTYEGVAFYLRLAN